MLIVTAVGPVNGQRHFRFVLEQKLSYTVGREKAANIRFDNRYLRPKEGVLEVGDWNPADHTTPPKLVWRPEPKKNGTFNALKLLAREDGEAGSIEKDDYRVEEQPGGGEIELVPGKGVELGAEAWFSVQWLPLHFSYDRMKDEDDELKATLRKYCLSWTEAFDVDDPPEVVIAAALKSSHDNNLAVCYGIPIVTPAWLSMLSMRLRACWKTVADSQDSFEVPSTSDPDYEPPMDDSMKKVKVRSDPAAWRPKKANRTLFKGWKAIVMRSAKRAIVDKKYFIAMGSGYDEVDVMHPPLKSPQDLIDRVQPAIKRAEEDGLTPFVVWHPQLKKDFEAQGSSVKDMIVGPCDSQHWYCTSGLILWGAVKTGGVKEFFEKVVAENAGGDEATTAATALVEATKSAPPQVVTPAAPEPEPQPAAEAGPSTGRLPRRAASRSTSRAPSHPPESTRPDIVPSTYPDDTASMAPPPTAKPLKRRAGRVKIDLDDDLDMSSQPSSQLPASYAQETQLFTQVSSGSDPSASLRSRVPDSMMDVDTPAASLMPSSSTATRAGSRLKRRAGGATQSTFLEGFDTTVNYQDALRKKEEEDDIRQLYEQTKRGPSTLEQAPAKRARMEQVTEEREASVLNTASIAELMDIDEENDFVAKALKSARDIKKEKEGRSPTKKRTPPQRTSPQRAPPKPVREATPEEEEELEEAPPTKGKGKGGALKQRATKAATQVDKDERFLQAIRTAVKKKQAVDELDKEFNNLRILKPGAKAKANVGAAKTLQQDHPDWAVVNDFHDQLRGNFIEVVRKDLLRKDGGTKTAVVEDHGKVNFKKFKKKNIVRREPLQLQLAAQTAHSAEMGEPYWATEQPLTQAKRGGTQAKSQSYRQTELYEEDNMPLVPTSRRRLLTQIREDDDDEETPTLAPSKRRRGATPNTQSPVLSAPTSRRARAGSALSDVSSAAPSEVAEPKTGRASSTRASTRAPPTQRARRGTQAAPVVLDSDDDDTPFATARTRAGGRSTAARGSGTAARSTTLNDEGTSLSRGTLPATGTRRRLLGDDDGDDVAFKGVQKKRRMG